MVFALAGDSTMTSFMSALNGLEIANVCFNTSAYDNNTENELVLTSNDVSTPTTIDPFVGGFITRTYTLTDACGNDATCSQLVTIVGEEKAPTPYCYDGLSVAVMPSTGSVQLWANDFDAGSFDNCGGELQLSMIPVQDVEGLSAEEAYAQSYSHPNVVIQPNGDYGFTFDCSYIENGVAAVIEV